MHKIALIIKREYLTRVKKKSFLIMSLLGPILFAAMFAVPIWLASRDSDEIRTIEIVDESGLITEPLEDRGNLRFVMADNGLDSSKKEMKESSVYGILHIPKITLEEPNGITFFSENSAGITTMSRLEDLLEERIKTLKLERSKLDATVIAGLKTNISLSEMTLADGEEKSANTGLYTGIGYIGALLIYFFIFIYGVQIMRGVVEEKSSRIVEVIISSVKPTQLMIGKIVGVAAVGFTQFLLWIILSFGLYSVGLSTIGLNDDRITQIQQMPDEELKNSEEFTEAQVKVANVFGSMESLPVALLVGSFVFYFLGGYLLYGSLFAAVGAAADSETDTQQFMMPVTMPLIFSIVMISVILRDPNSSLAFWLSIIPLTSPIIMMMRIPFGVPGWEIVLSMVLLLLGFLACAWIAGRIYRVGILMHGSKVNYKTLGKWLMMR